MTPVTDGTRALGPWELPPASVRSAGADGCAGGWVVAVVEPEGRLFLSTTPKLSGFLEAAWSEEPGRPVRLLADVPIGLPTLGEPRACDREARRLLGRPRSSSVFPVPCRRAIYAGSYEEARDVNRRTCGKGVSKQAWNLAPKVREVDALMRSDPRARSAVRESHPELAFWALAGERPMRHYKKTPEGRSERLGVLAEFAGVEFATRLEALARGGVGHLEKAKQGPKPAPALDDVLDAAALAITARQAPGGVAPVPDPPERDELGLPAEMVVVDWDLKAKRE
ncbi:MAG: DUF429 domain-containing protein [Promethearchaeota archaeon]